MFLESDHSFDGTQKDDEELWLAYLEGQQKDLGKIFLHHYSRLYRYGIKLVRDDGVVRDGIQELFLKLWKTRTKINKVHSVEFYLLHALRRILFRQKEQISSFHRRNREYMEEASHSLQSVEDKIIFKEQENERYQLFLRARQSLTDRQKEILYLRLQHGMTNEEIAGFLDLSIQRVKNCIYETTKHLKKEIFNSSVGKCV